MRRGRVILARESDIVVVNMTNRTKTSIDVYVLLDGNIKTKERRKID